MAWTTSIDSMRLQACETHHLYSPTNIPFRCQDRYQREPGLTPFARPISAQHRPRGGRVTLFGFLDNGKMSMLRSHIGLQGARRVGGVVVEKREWRKGKAEGGCSADGA